MFFELNEAALAAEIISLICRSVKYYWVSSLSVTVSVYLFPLIIESAFLLLFLFILATRGTQRGRNLLLISSAIIVFFAFRTILEVVYNSMMPMPPPPEVWEESYYDILTLRSWASTKAQIDAAIIFVLALSYTYARSQEWSLQPE